MANRRYMIGGNWKCNTTLQTARDIAAGVAVQVTEESAKKVDVVVFPPFPYLLPVGEVLKKNGSRVFLGAQDVYVKGGAFTGAVSVGMLKDLGVSHVLVGHSERRHILGDCDHIINKKLRVILDAGMSPVLCIGEKLEERDAQVTNNINAGQLQYGLAGVSAEEMKRVAIAYEPVWAIGTGRTATPEQANETQKAVRAELEHMYGSEVAQSTTIQYGGSMNAKNCADLLGNEHVDGGLIGGASLKPPDFGAIISAALACQK